MLADIPFARLDAILLLAKLHLKGVIPKALNLKDSQIFIDYLAGGLCRVIALERLANAFRAKVLAAAGAAAVPVNEQPQTNVAAPARGSGDGQSTGVVKAGAAAPVSYSGRDAMVVEFELNLRCWIISWRRTRLWMRLVTSRAWLFNLNQIAFVIEGSFTKGDQKKDQEEDGSVQGGDRI